MKLRSTVQYLKSLAEKLSQEIFERPEHKLICNYCNKPIKDRDLNYDKATGMVYHRKDCSMLGLTSELKGNGTIKPDIIKIPRLVGFILLKRGSLKQPGELGQEKSGPKPGLEATL